MKYPKQVEDLIEVLSKLPTIGKKSALRLALHILLKFDEETKLELINSVENLKDIKICKQCHNISLTDYCDICNDSNREKTVMIVENIKDLISLENTGVYSGLYYVLGNLIDFSKGISVEDININDLITLIEKCQVDEVILALNSTVEGELTSQYIKALLEDYKLKITRIGYGIPVGSDLEYADQLTLTKALENRNIIK